MTVSSLAEVFIISVLVSPALPRLNLRQISEPSVTTEIRSQPPGLNANRSEQKAARARGGLKGSPNRSQVKPPAPAAGADKAASRPLALGFYVNWDDSSYESLKRHLDQIDQLVPEWLWLQAGDHPVISELDPRALDLVRGWRPDLPIIPMIHNLKDGKWEPQTLARQIADEASRSRLVNELARFVGDNHFQGVCVDFEDVPDASRKNLLAFMQSLHAAFKQRNWVVMQVAPFDDSGWDYRAYAAASDYQLLTAYDEHWGAGAPGSIAGQPWLRRRLLGLSLVWVWGVRRLARFMAERQTWNVPTLVFHQRETLAQKVFQARLEAARDRVLAVGLLAPQTRHGQNMHKRFVAHGKEYFTFVTTPGVEPTNNLAEQAIRFVAIHRRLTQGTRGPAGQRWCERIWTVVTTCAQHGRSAFDFLVEAVTAHFQGSPRPSLLPDTT